MHPLGQTRFLPAYRRRAADRLVLGVAALVAMALLWGCAPVSEFQRPPPPIPGDWPTLGAGAGRVDAARTHWRTFFPDPRLQTLIATALDNNRDLRIAAGRVLEARAQYGIVRSDQSPALGLLGSGNITRSPAELRTIGTSPVSSRFDVSVSSVSFELDFWGRLARLSESARSSYLATEEAQRATHIALVADVAAVYFSQLQMEELTALARTSAELRAQSLVLITKGRDIGGAYDYEYEQARAQFETARANLAALEHQRAVASNHLRFLVGQLPDQLPEGSTLDQQGLDADLAPGLPAEVLLMRPDVLAAEQRLIAAHANIGAARAAFLPKVTLTAGLGLASQGLLGLFTGGAWSFLPSITMPLFDGGRTAAGVDLAEARKIIAVAEYEKTIQQAFREVADLLSARASLTRQLRASVENRIAQERRLEIAQARYQGGLISYLEVLEGQREVIAAQQNNAQVRRAQLEAAAQLYKALGGGNENAA
jgi:multidrug efflux system outer membrane protein